MRKDEKFVPGIPPLEVGSGRNEFFPVPSHNILSTPLEERVWVWDLWIPQGSLVLLSALPKAGKTTFVYRLALAIARGEPFLGFNTKKTEVLILAVEEHKYDVYSRLIKIGLKPADNIHVHTGYLQMLPQKMKDIQQYVEMYDIGLIVVDTLSHFWPVEDENDNAEVSKHMQRLLKLRDETGVSILLIHHQRKNDMGGVASGTAIRGAGALLASVDQAITLQRQSGNKCRRVLSSIGRYSDTPEELIIELQNGIYIALGDSQQSIDQDSFKLIERVMSATPKDIGQLASETKLAERFIRRLLDQWGTKYRVTGGGKKNDPYKWSLKDVDL